MSEGRLQKGVPFIWFSWGYDEGGDEASDE
jgi:hypothetical protein